MFLLGVHGRARQPQCLAQESGFTLFAIPFLMELLDFLTAQVQDQFRQSVICLLTSSAGNAGKSKERDAGQALARHHKERMGRRRDPVPSLRECTLHSPLLASGFPYVSMVSMKQVAGALAKYSSGVIRRLRLACEARMVRICRSQRCLAVLLGPARRHPSQSPLPGLSLLIVRR